MLFVAETETSQPWHFFLHSFERSIFVTETRLHFQKLGRSLCLLSHMICFSIAR